MEKVVIISGSTPYSISNPKDVNEYLDKGWSVKSIHTTVNKDLVAIVFVLER